MRARGALAAGLALALAVSGSGSARASTPTLGTAMSAVTTLDAQLGDTRSQLRSATAGLMAEAMRLERASERVERLWIGLQAQRSSASPANAGYPAARLRATHVEQLFRRATTALHHEQQRARSEASLPLVVRLQGRRDRLIQERRREQALVRALTGTAPSAEAGVGETREQWAVSLLHALDAPVCSNNVVALVTWQTAEGTDAAWNPLATTQPALGATDYNAVGVKNYPTAAAGIGATIATLRWGYATQGYGWILYRLASCDDAAQTARAINLSGWCRGCAGGAYVTGMLDEVRSRYDAYARS